MTADFEHGYSAYVNHCCRCDTCRAANAEYIRAKRSRARERRDLAAAAGRRHYVDGITHGLSGYLNFCCRCDTCIDRTRSYNRERYRRGRVS